ncbi:MAG TPA: protein kinase [Thermoanaerobaculia bacterium]|nr:protein kinase [Thermoanaerobaculia bacterium]
MLTNGSRLGPYEILGPLGAGGMGEVYRARDERLRREVAVKVLSADVSDDPDRRKRFEQEARAASSLNHHNLVTIHDIGEKDGAVYIAMELVEGRTLRDIQSEGPMPTKRLIEVAFQMADGLAKAHSAGIVHRDLKPENVMLTKDGVIKILDFGLAKLLPREGELSQDSATAIQETRPGTVLGTIGYMSPEQASGKPADFRSDQFSLGSILYELATGKRAFQRATTAETLTAIIREEAEPVGKLNSAVPAPFRWLIERCLSKDPEGRYAATRDLASDLRSIRDHLSEASLPGSVTGPAPMTPVSRPRRGRAFIRSLAVLGILAAFALGMLAQKRFNRSAPPSYQQITFGSGTIRSARFAPDGQTIVYSVAWDGTPLKLFLKHPSSPDSLPLALPSANLLGISPTGEMAIALDCRSNHPGVCAGTLARAALTGGSPRGVAEGVQETDWAADGEKFLVVRDVDGKGRIEYPLGKVLYQTSGHISYARLSPRGDRIAFLDHPFPLDDAGTVAVIDLDGKKTTLTGKWASEHGLAWEPSGREVWFTATEAGANRSLYAVSLDGKLRVVARVPGGLKLHDIAKNGRVLLTRESPRVGIRGTLAGDEREKDMSFLDYSFAADIANDGKTLLFDEEGEAGGANYTVFLRKADNSPVVRLGEGNALALSPDGKWALAIIPLPDKPFLLLPTGTGEHREIALAGVSAEQGATWLPDSQAFVFGGSEKGHGVRVYVQAVAGGKARPITPEGVNVALPGFAITADGKWLAAIGPDGKGALFSVENGSAKPLSGVGPGEFPLRFSPDDKHLYLWKRGDIPARVTRLEIATGKRELWKDLMPVDPAGVERISNVLIAPDAKSYAYCYARLLSDLFVVEGLK